jgi:pilus assembly protein CpaF
MSGINFPMHNIHQQITSALDLIVQVSQFKDGSVKLTSITEISGMEADEVMLTDLFRYKQAGVDATGKPIGSLNPTGIRPLFSARLEANGFKLSAETFGTNLQELFLSES